MNYLDDMQLWIFLVLFVGIGLLTIGSFVYTALINRNPDKSWWPTIGLAVAWVASGAMYVISGGSIVVGEACLGVCS